MTRKVLLIEPNYKNKYPPMGLMKISTYHKMLGDKVTFYKGEFRDFILNEICDELVQKLRANDEFVNWIDYTDIIKMYIKKGLSVNFEMLKSLSPSCLVEENLKYYRNYFLKKLYINNPKWDRIYITTLFTFHWTKTIDTINSFKILCKDINEVKIGGIAASLVPDEFEKETGIRPYVGLLDKGGEYDDNDIIIDHLPLDYSILDEIGYKYPENEGYYAYMTRGCVNKCSFCAVPEIEPEYNCFISIKDQIEYINDKYGPKKNLLLLDNNVLASSQFDQIIDEIKECGFYKGATFLEPNKYEVAYNALVNGYNDKGYIRNIILLYKQIYKKCAESQRGEIYTHLYDNGLLELETATKENIIKLDYFFRPLFQKYHKPRPKTRYVDFNQGVDARFINEHNIKRLSEIPIYPLRIAFDSWNLRRTYENAVRLAADNGIRNMSNYLLYNFNDHPVELYHRMKLNIGLCDELDVSIYSFPMKYHPIQDPEYFRDRTFIGKHWNRKFIRSIQAILNSTKGKVGRGKEFFEEAFGADEKGYEKLLYMPEALIIYRFFYKENGITEKWWNAFNNLPDEKKEPLKRIIEANDFTNIYALTSDEEILEVLKYYTIKREDAEKEIRLNDDSLE